MKSKERDSHLEKIGAPTILFLNHLLKNQRFEIVVKLLQNSHFDKLQVFLAPVWRNAPLHSFEFLRRHANSLKKEISIWISKMALEGTASLPLDKQCSFFANQRIAEFCDKELFSERIGNLIIELIKNFQNHQTIEKCLNFLERYRPKESVVWVTVFDWLQNFSDPKRVLELVKISFQELPLEAVDAKLKGCQAVLQCLKNRNSSPLTSFFKEFLFLGSPIYFLLNQTQDLNLRLETLLMLAEALIGNEKCLGIHEIEKAMASIIDIANITESNELEGSFITLYLSVYNYAISISKDHNLFESALAKTASFLVKNPNCVPEKMVFQLLKKGVEHENQSELEEGFLAVAMLFTANDSRRLERTVYLLSFYESAKILRLSLELFECIFLKKGKKTSPCQKDTKIGKTFIQCVEKVSRKEISENYEIIKVLLQQECLLEHLSLNSLRNLWMCIEEPLKSSSLEMSLNQIKVKLNNLIQHAKFFNSDQELLNKWREVIFQFALPFLKKGDSPEIFYSSFFELFTTLLSEQDRPYIGISKKNKSK